VPVVHAVTSSAGPNGSVTPTGSLGVEDGATAQYSVTPNSGYTASVEGTCGGSLTGTVFTTNRVTADCSVVGVFTAEPGTTQTRPSPPTNLIIQ
jgi:hypothetical protein